MRFTILSAAILVTLSSSRPMTSEDFFAQHKMATLVAEGCDVIGCLKVLANVTATCAEALVQLGANIEADIDCFNSVKDIVVEDNACKACLP